MSSPWAEINVPNPTSLQDIMTEEFAKDLQAKKEKKYLDAILANEDKSVQEMHQNVFHVPSELLQQEEMLKSDVEIAKMLQQQYDKEHDMVLKRSEEKLHGASKVSVSFISYCRVPQNFGFESDPEEEDLEDIRHCKDWAHFGTLQRELAVILPSSYKVYWCGKIITKHEIIMNNRKNTYKLPFQTADNTDFYLQLSNKVFNSFKTHSKHKQARSHKIHDKKEDRAMAEFSVDQFTRLILYKMINSQLLVSVNCAIGIGKEAVVLHAETHPQYSKCVLPKECCIKVFSTTLSEYKQREQYIKDDSRFKSRFGTKMNTRRVVHLWAEKEMHNLVRLQKAGIPCPEVIALKNHVLVMSFIGENKKPAQKLAESYSDVDSISAYEQVVKYMKVLYTKANLIHADLSERNILWHKGICYFIDVSQSVEPQHENAFEFLFRDCVNISNHFILRGVPEVFPANALFKEIAGYDYGDKMELLRLQESVKMNAHLLDTPGMESNHSLRYMDKIQERKHSPTRT